MPTLMNEIRRSDRSAQVEKVRTGPQNSDESNIATLSKILYNHSTKVSRPEANESKILPSFKSQSMLDFLFL